ncbi:CNP1-like family protein [Rhodoferax sp.]|uniref:CNP1-like family protein n=1 Tax=Rhodoferax sp. TaxID=50421 RepID=UPI002ACE2E6C|nr:CNP1-like family protein [Rhodoferax sp.]MDZ7919102.1 CNP1-like family protein [Rhodoferax sp.]
MNKWTRKALAAALAVCAACASWAQTSNGLDNLDWVEEKEPPPPAFLTTRALPLEMPNYVSVRVGIDPATVTVGKDGVVRYVVVMSNATGTVNAAYEGIRCASDQVKVYARAGASGEWSVLPEPAWRDVNGNQPSKHAFVFARLAACDVRVANRLEDVIKALQTQQRPRSAKPSTN